MQKNDQILEFIYKIEDFANSEGFHVSAFEHGDREISSGLVEDWCTVKLTRTRRKYAQE